MLTMLKVPLCVSWDYTVCMYCGYLRKGSHTQCISWVMNEVDYMIAYPVGETVVSQCELIQLPHTHM